MISWTREVMNDCMGVLYQRRCESESPMINGLLCLVGGTNSCLERDDNGRRGREEEDAGGERRQEVKWNSRGQPLNIHTSPATGALTTVANIATNKIERRRRKMAWFAELFRGTTCEREVGVGRRARGIISISTRSFRLLNMCHLAVAEAAAELFRNRIRNESKRG